MKNQSTCISTIEEKWDKIYQNSIYSQPSAVLTENYFLLPKKGLALDLACGLGMNSLFLANKGLHVEAWDISSNALNKLQKKASENQLNITAKQVFIKSESIPKNTFDIIIITRFLDRSLSNAIMEGLKTGGLLFYQTYVKEKLEDSGPKNSQFLLSRNELLKLFQPLYLVSYRENSRLGDLTNGERNEAFFVGQKP